MAFCFRKPWLRCPRAVLQLEDKQINTSGKLEVLELIFTAEGDIYKFFHKYRQVFKSKLDEKQDEAYQFLWIKAVVPAALFTCPRRSWTL